MSFKFEIDADALSNAFKGLEEEAYTEIKAAVAELAMKSVTHLREDVSIKLKSSSALKLYKDNIGFEEVTPGVWVISLDTPALPIEEGGPQWDMKPGLLKNAKTGADGKRFKVVPFDHGLPPSQRNNNANSIVTELKKGLSDINKIRKENQEGRISIHKIETGPNGSPLLGKLHAFDIPSMKPTDKAKHPALQGLSIYQSLNEKGKVERSVMTFRTVSDRSGADTWIYPEKEGVKLMDAEFLQFIDNCWSNEILPTLFKGLK